MRKGSVMVMSQLVCGLSYSGVTSTPYNEHSALCERQQEHDDKGDDEGAPDEHVRIGVTLEGVSEGAERVVEH